MEILRFIAQIFLIIGIFVVTLFSLTPREYTVAGEYPDKLIHMIVYASLAMAGHVGFSRKCPSSLIAVGLLLFGCLIEVAQHFVPGRTPSIADALANGVGVTLAVLTVRMQLLMSALCNSR